MAENDENMSANEAGKKGDEKAAQERGPEFYAETGRKGGHSQDKDKNHSNAAANPENGGVMNQEAGDE